MIARRGVGPGGLDPIVFIGLFLLIYAFVTGSMRSPLRDCPGDPVGCAGFLIAVVIGITIHEFMHAYTAHRLGDDTARLLGRLSLNPMRHFDPFGTLLLVIAGFGYGKPVPVNEARLRTAVAISAVSLAGPLSNFVVAAVCAIPLRFDAASGDYGLILAYVVQLNLVLGVFNLIPIPPLDGSKVVYGLLPPRQQYAWRTYEQYGPFLLLALLLFGGRLLDSLIFTPVNALMRFLIGS